MGLSSFGVRCGFAVEFPGVFADVFYYREWILDNMNVAFSIKPETTLLIGLIAIVIRSSSTL